MNYAAKLIAFKRAYERGTSYLFELEHPDKMQAATLAIEARELAKDERKADQKLRAFIRRELAKCEEPTT